MKGVSSKEQAPSSAVITGSSERVRVRQRSESTYLYGTRSEIAGCDNIVSEQIRATSATALHSLNLAENFDIAS